MVRNAGIRAVRHDIIATDDDVVAIGLAARARGRFCLRRRRRVSQAGPELGELRTPPQAYFDWRVWATTSRPPGCTDCRTCPTTSRFSRSRSVRHRRQLPPSGERSSSTSACSMNDWEPARPPAAEGPRRLLPRTGLRHSLAIEPASIIWHRHRSDNDALLTGPRLRHGPGRVADQGGTGQGPSATGPVRAAPPATCGPEQVVPTARSRHRHRHS